MTYLKFIHLFLCLIFFTSKFFSQSYYFKNYSTDQGLAQSQVLCIYQDHKGNMWFGTNSGGASKYDGNTFNTISTNDGLLDNFVYSITETNKQELAFGTSKGLSIFNGFAYSHYTQKEGLSNSFIYKLQADGNKLWIGTQQGVYIYQNSKIISFNQDSILNQSSIWTILVDAQKNLWFATQQNGLIYYNIRTKNFKHFTSKDGLMSNNIISLVQKNNQEILIGTQTGLNSISSDFKILKVSEIPKNENIGFTALLKTNIGHILIGSSGDGMLDFDVKRQKTMFYNQSNGLMNNYIFFLYQDKEQNIWIATGGLGVYKFKNEKLSYYDNLNTITENYVNALTQDKNGNYWVSIQNNGVYQINKKNKSLTHLLSSYKSENTIPDNNINTILNLKDSSILFGTNEGLTIYRNNKFQTITNFNFRQKNILSLYQDSKDNTWIGTIDGLFKFKNDSIYNVKQINSFKQKNDFFLIYFIIEDKYKNLWLGTDNGVIKFDGVKATAFNKKKNFTDEVTYSCTSDNNKNLWFGSADGLYFYNLKTFKKIFQKDGLCSNTINSLKVDNHNRLIITTNNGIDILDLNAYYNNKISIKHLGKEDGLLCNESNLNAIIKDKEGRILIGTPNGVEIYDPRYDVENTQEAITRIDKVKLFFGQEDVFKYSKHIDSTTLLPKNLELPFNKNHITFQFIGVSLTAPEKVKYTYKLDGLDDEWSPPSNKTEATYSSLQPGSYKFLLKACNNDGLWNKEPVVYEFVVLAPWYRTWWFYGLCVVILVSGISLYNYVKTKKLVAAKEKLERVVDERTRELRDEKEKVELVNKEVIQQKTIIEHKNEEITDSIKYAKNIQEALLPNLNEINNLFQNNFVLYMPKDIVSGDFYWFAKSGDTQLIAAADCTGHGVPGAFMSIVGNTLLREIVIEKNITTPGDILLELHKGVKIALNQSSEQFERRDGMDITLCAFNTKINEVQYAGANRPLWIYRKNNDYELEIIKPSKFPIGGLELEENRTYQNHVIKVQKGDCLYLFSDGYADQFGGPKGKKFMLSHLQKVLLEIVTLPMNIQKQKLKEAFIAWKQDTEQIDDVLVIGIMV